MSEQPTQEPESPGRRPKLSPRAPYEEKLSQHAAVLQDPGSDPRDRRLARLWLRRHGHADLVQSAEKPATRKRPAGALRAELIPAPNARSLALPELAVRVKNRRAVVCDLATHLAKNCPCFDQGGQRVSR